MGNSSGSGAPNLPTPGGILPTSRCPRGSEVALARSRGAGGRGGGLMVAAELEVDASRVPGERSPGRGGDSPTGCGPRVPVPGLPAAAPPPPPGPPPPPPQSSFTTQDSCTLGQTRTQCDPEKKAVAQVLENCSIFNWMGHGGGGGGTNRTVPFPPLGAGCSSSEHPNRSIPSAALWFNHCAQSLNLHIRKFVLRAPGKELLSLGKKCSPFAEHGDTPALGSWEEAQTLRSLDTPTGALGQSIAP
ncbi:hypothetical protein TREES_T100001791 [Tupaia chinensis]|uniref:Uncharacterized protein n=1 Tax=Tupaia chinensis TaxID=246437 RepID=L9KPI5_TUPCH|nr:hypothetical protein TREES_T100001791 [Tupaia chinensis]